jgi:hypothetical protein
MRTILMNSESTEPNSRARRFDADAPRQADAEGLYAATTMLLAEGRAKGFHFYALHLAVALRELEDQAGLPLRTAPPPTSLARQRPKISAAMRRLIRGGEATD